MEVLQVSIHNLNLNSRGCRARAKLSYVPRANRRDADAEGPVAVVAGLQGQS